MSRKGLPGMPLPHLRANVRLSLFSLLNRYFQRRRALRLYPVRPIGVEIGENRAK